MRPRVDSSWIDVVVGDNRTFVVRDHGQLRHVVSELPDPGHQYPMLSIFIGRREKDITLQVLFPHNNIRRSRSTSSIGLRADILTAETEAPVLFADGDLVAGARYLSNPPRTTDHTVAWGSLPAQKALRMVYSRLLFTFADLVCIFGDDYPDLIDVAQFLVDCVKAPPVCGLPITARPRVVVLVQGHPGSSQTNGVEINFFKKLGEADITQVSQWFSAVNLIHLDHQATGSTKYERLKSWIRKYRHETQATRQECWARYNALHLEAFFASAVSSLASCTEASFDFVLATRQGLPVTPGLSHHISQYLEVGSQARCKLDTLLSTIASALLMDHYIPGMPCKLVVPSLVPLSLFSISAFLGSPSFSFPHQQITSRSHWPSGKSFVLFLCSKLGVQFWSRGLFFIPCTDKPPIRLSVASVASETKNLWATPSHNWSQDS